MNFKMHLIFSLLFIISLTISLSACGVKSPPIPYPEKAIDSYVETFGSNSTSNPTPVSTPTPTTKAEN